MKSDTQNQIDFLLPQEWHVIVSVFIFKAMALVGMCVCLCPTESSAFPFKRNSRHMYASFLLNHL